MAGYVRSGDTLTLFLDLCPGMPKDGLLAHAAPGMGVKPGWTRLAIEVEVPQLPGDPHGESPEQTELNELMKLAGIVTGVETNEAEEDRGSEFYGADGPRPERIRDEPRKSVAKKRSTKRRRRASNPK